MGKCGVIWIFKNSTRFAGEDRVGLLKIQIMLTYPMYPYKIPKISLVFQGGTSACEAQGVKRREQWDLYPPQRLHAIVWFC